MDQQEHRNQIAAKVKAARNEKGWSQARLAREAKVSPNTVLSIEKARRNPQPDKLRTILDILDLAAPDDALDLKEVPEDVRRFLRVVVQRLSLLPEDRRAVVMARLYPVLILDD
jgi:transcriptional regulator with XRE-family HTH domain